MAEETEIADLRRRVALLEQDAEGERTVGRTMLRKLNGLEDALADLTRAAAEIAKGFGRLETFVMVSNAEMPRKVAEIVTLTMREERARLAEDLDQRDAKLAKLVAETITEALRRK